MGRVTVLALEPGLSPQDLLEGLAGRFPMEVEGPAEEAVAYWDTFDWLLLRAGLVLTTSTSGTGGLKRVSVSSADGRTVSQVVPSFPAFAGDIPDGHVRARVLPIAGHRRFMPRGRATWATTRVAILNEDQKTVVRLRIREGRAIAEEERDGVRFPPRLECHTLKGYGSEQRRVFRFLRRTFRLKPDARSEQTLVFHASGQTPFDYSSSFCLTLDPETPAAEAARQVHRELFQNVLRNREGVLGDWDSEFLHDFRVAVRRTRSALGQIKGVFPEAAVAHFSEEFQWLGAKTGPTRDMDVYLLTIPSYRKTLGRDVAEDLEPLVRLLKEKKRLELRKLRHALRSARFRRLMEEWTAFLSGQDHPEPPPPRAREPIALVASHRIWKVFSKVLKKGGEIGPKASAGKLHRLRIECKKLRYLLTFFQSLYPESVLTPMIKDLKRLQDHLGDFNDLQVQQEALGSFAEELMERNAGPPATLLAMGQLMGKLEGRQLGERRAFEEYFEAFARPANQQRFRDAFGPPDGSDENPPNRSEAP